MKKIIKERGKGKTTRLMYISEYKQIPIIVGDNKRKLWLIDTAKRFDINMPEPLTIDEFLVSRGNHIEDVLIDDVEYILMKIFGSTNIEAFTMSNEN